MPLRLLPGEHVELRLRPHAIGFSGRYFVAAWPAILGAALLVMFQTSWWQTADTGKWYQVWTFLYGNMGAAYVYFLAGMLLMGAIAGLAMVRMGLIVLFGCIGAAVVAGTVVTGGDTQLGLPLLAMVAAIPMLFVVDLQRRSHSYILTNIRVLFRGGLFVRRERQLKYEAITDLDTSQSVWARMFRVGTIIPVTQSGFGLGADSAEAGIVLGGGASRGGVMAGAGVTAGGGKEVQVGRARTFHQLTGVRPFHDVKYTLENLIQEATATPYLRQQVEVQRQMLEQLERLQTLPPEPPATR